MKRMAIVAAVMACAVDAAPPDVSNDPRCTDDADADAPCSCDTDAWSVDTSRAWRCDVQCIEPPVYWEPGCSASHPEHGVERCEHTVTVNGVRGCCVGLDVDRVFGFYECI